jgi:hypothetical protein
MAKTAAFLTLLAVGACTAPTANQQEAGRDSASPAPAGTQGSGGAASVAGVRLALLPPSRTGDAATTAGQLEAEGSCLYVRPPAGERLLLALTVPGVRWDAAAQALLVPGAGGGTFRLGDTVRLGGSQASAAALSNQWVQAPEGPCDTRRIWIAHQVSAASG